MDSRTIAWSPANRGPLLKPSMSTSLWSRLPSRRYSARAPGAEPLGCGVSRVADCPGSPPIGLAAAQPAGAHIVDPSTRKRPRNPGRTSHFHKRRSALSEGAHRAVHRARPCHVRARTTEFPHSRASSYGVGGGRLLIGRTCTHLRLPDCQKTAPPLQIRTLSRRRTRSNRNANQRQLSGVQAREMRRNRK